MQKDGPLAFCKPPTILIKKNNSMNRSQQKRNYYTFCTLLSEVTSHYTI